VAAALVAGAGGALVVAAADVAAAALVVGAAELAAGFLLELEQLASVRDMARAATPAIVFLTIGVSFRVDGIGAPTPLGVEAG
jgi:hypothetical protein